MHAIALVAAGSVAGGLARFGMAWAAQRWLSPGWPWGTLAANLLGCLLIGALDALWIRQSLGLRERVLLMTGFCGAMTTFSTLILELAYMAREGLLGRAAFYLLGSVALGAGAFLAGTKLVR